MNLNNNEINDVKMETNFQDEEKKTEEKLKNETVNCSTSQKPYIEVYLNTLLHAVTCTNINCAFVNCSQFKRVLQHSKNCQKYKNGECEFCRQLITLCIYHAKNCKEDECQVPLCSSIKIKLGQQTEIKQSVAFVTTNLGALRFKSKADSSTQFRKEQTSNKRKLSSYGEHEDLPLEHSSQPNETATTDANLLNKQIFFDNLSNIKKTLASKTDTTDTKRLSKTTRLELVKYFYKFCLSDLLFGKKSETNYADFVVLLLRQELEIDKIANDSVVYLHLITEYFYEVSQKLDSMKKHEAVETQTDTFEPINDEIKEEGTTSSDDSNNKRFKSE